jgi:serine/threonine-protein kinase HipA
MRGCVFVNAIYCGLLEKINKNHYRFSYDETYKGPPVSLTMPLTQKEYTFHHFPPFFDGLLPEGLQLEALLRSRKLDSDDYLGQLLCVGSDLIGTVTVIRDTLENNNQGI